MVVYSPSTYEMGLSALHDRYCDYALTVRNVTGGCAEGRRTYLTRLFDFLGPPGNAEELFAKNWANVKGEDPGYVTRGGDPDGTAE